MANRKISIYKYVRLGKSWRYCKPVIGANNKIKPNWVIIPGGKEEYHDEGSYYLNIAGQWKCVGSDPAEAVAARKRELVRLAAQAEGLEVKQDTHKEDEQTGTVTEAVKAYLDNIREAIAVGNRRPRTLTNAKHILAEFQAFSKKKLIKEVTRQSLFEYVAWAKAQSPSGSARTAQNKFIRVNQFLKFSGVNIAKNCDGPRVPKNEPVYIYEDEQLEKFFAVCNPFQKIIFNTFLKGGFRESELKYARWDWVNFEKGYLRVQANPDYDFIPKTKDPRDVYLPPDVIEQLRTLKLTAKHKLIFPTASGKPNEKLLRTCKRIAASAGLNAEEFWLHKFRSHFATVCLRGGMDIETLRSQMGHSKNSKSIWSYLMALQGKSRAAKVAEIWAVPLPPVQAQAVAAGVQP